jgi:hypothetical protein
MAAGDERKFRVNDEFLLKEAQTIINDYIRENKLSVTPDRRGCKNKAYQKNKAFANILINFALLGSVALLLFLVVKLF